MVPTVREEILKIARQKPVFRPQEIRVGRNPRKVLAALVAEGELVRVARGLYSAPDADFGSKITMAEAATRHPDGLVCLLTALRFHELTEENPPVIWMAFDHKRPIRSDYPSLRVVRMSGPAFSEGAVSHVVEEVPVRITSPAKTIIDCFKFRSRVGLDVALGSLRDGWRRRLFTMDELWELAGVCRVRNVIRPYLEML
ncbi:MAG: type IV toxin-antitoxin system AbiEi family antitoxin domain-containing protein [Candidatus Sumerlaeia bacterium]|nr:type IV toxin-antitoxin system AbiEi family antitoxin domain-containing protein [Candidatus Sumerlaeia bacterium]